MDSIQTCNMNRVCRLCLSGDECNVPIFSDGDEDVIPLSSKIFACVAVEVNSNDGLPAQICPICLQKVNSWQDFKETCDTSQATLRTWLKENIIQPPDDCENRRIVIKEEPIDIEEDNLDDSVIFEDSVEFVSDDDVNETVQNTNDDENSELREIQILNISEEEVNGHDFTTTESVNVEFSEEYHQGATGASDPLSLPESSGNISSGPVIKVEPEDSDVEEYDGDISYDTGFCNDDIDLNCVSNGGSLSVSGLFDSDKPENNINFIPKRKRKFVKRLTLRKKQTVKRIPVNDTNFGKVFNCSKCEAFFPDVQGLIDHVNVHDDDENKCNICCKSFTSKTNLLKHMCAVHSEQNSYNCSECSLCFTSKSDYSQHLLTMHNIYNDDLDAANENVDPESTEEADSRKRTFPCYVCHKEFTNFYQMATHRRSHNSFSCPKCKKSFSGGRAFANHIRIHRLASVDFHFCSICWKLCSSKPALISHKKIHATTSMEENAAVKIEPIETVEKVNPMPQFSKSLTRPNPFFKARGCTCKVCGKWFRFAGMLQRHMAVHTKAKLFRCPICNAGMSYASSLGKHIKKIHGRDIKTMNMPVQALPSSSNMPLQAHTCTICHKSFSVKSLLVSHIKIIHMGGKAYKCKTCSKMFTSKSELFRHVSSHASNSETDIGDSKVNTGDSEAYAGNSEADTNNSGVETPFRCNVCLKYFPELKTLNLHKGVHTRYKYYSCNICSQSFNGIKLYKMHLLTHKAATPAVKTEVVSEIEPDTGSAVDAEVEPEIISYSTPTGRYTCRLCFKVFFSRVDLYVHKKMHIKLKLYTCTQCKNSYNSLSALNKHKLEHDAALSAVDPLANNTTIVNQNIFSCEQCKQTFTRLTSFNKHRLMHLKMKQMKVNKTVVPSGGVVKFVCKLCNKVFKDRYSFVTHKGWHARKKVPLSIQMNMKKVLMESQMKAKKNNILPSNSIEDKIYACIYCNKELSSHVGLQKHFKYCKRRPDIITANTVEPAAIKTEPLSEEIMNQTVKPEASKPKISSQSNNVNNPNTNSPAVNSFVCNICGRGFNNKSVLNSHKGWHFRSPGARKVSSKIISFPTTKRVVYKAKKTVAYSKNKVFFSSGSKPVTYSRKKQNLNYGERKPAVTGIKPMVTVKSEVISKPPAFTVNMPTFSGNAVMKKKGNNKGPTQCDICEKRFSCRSNLYRHKRVHFEQMFSESNKQVASPKKVATPKKVIISPRKELPIIKEEPKENYVGGGSADMENFVEFSTHFLEGNTESDSEFKCTLCPAKFVEKIHLTQHIRQHRGNKPFPCDECDQSFSHSSSLWRHKQTHKSFPLSCNFCGRGFNQNERLLSHIAKNHQTPQDVYGCSKCDNTFTSMSLLQSHELVHKS